MNNLRASIEILFRNIGPDVIIKRYLAGNSSYITVDDFRQQAFGLLPYYSHDEIDNLFSKVCNDWAKDFKKNISYIYQLVFNFSSKVLIEESGLPKVKYEHLLRWRDLSHRIGEDLFVCNYLAFKDNEKQSIRDNFNWRPVLDTNNQRLKILLSKGIAENHFHLSGSAPYSELSWISLMNNIEGQLPKFKEILKDGLLNKSENITDIEDCNLYFLTIKAAIIRACFFSLLMRDEPLFNNLNDKNGYLFQLLNGKSNKQEGEFLVSQITFVQREIELLRFEYGIRRDNYSIADYAITKRVNTNNDNGNFLLSGERWFLYSMFRQLQNPENYEKLNQFKDLFYAYLLCKSKFREELLQVNTKTGFTNFSKYQKRKEVFLADLPLFKKAISSMAIRTSNLNQHISTFEARISPNKISQIQKVDKDVCFEYTNGVDKFLNCDKEMKEPNHFYVIHFLKKRDSIDLDKISFTKPRHFELRKEIKEQALNLINAREISNKDASRIYGIDAASNEILTRPEIFATIFRCLKEHYPKRINPEISNFLKIKPMPKLRATYHVAEDFLDIVDGLRAIDEAIKFLELGEGDRIGHALALGIDVEYYYSFKHYKLLLSKQNLLDNYSWMLSRIAKYGMNEFMSLQALILNDFRILFQEIYGEKIKVCDPIFYYLAWTLRGDDPDLYKTEKYLKNEINFLEYDYFRKCKYPNDTTRYNENVVEILMAYQYDTTVMKLGNEITEFGITEDYIKAVNVIQKKMQLEVAHKHIAVECNPSSNFLIGTFKRYDKHPIVNFYNLGLTTDNAEIKICPQLMVSINTDDQGVFNTYLENEYAIMALALEKAKDKDGNLIYNNAMIYDWLERIRQMGLEMSFKEPIL